jgi:type VI protein secretion system component Hcp
MLAFMQIIDSGGKAIPGEATATGYNGWCVVDSVDYEVSGDDGDKQSGDDGVFTLRVGKLVDSATHRIMECALMQAGSSQAHFKSVVVEVVGVNQKTSSGGITVAQLRTVLKIVMTDVWVTDWKIRGESSWSVVSEEGVPTESVDFRFSKVSFVYSDMVYENSSAAKSKGAYVFEADAKTLSARSWLNK